MKIYNYNIRCKVCKKGFNPKNKQNAYNNMCPKCFENRPKYVDLAAIEKNIKNIKVNK